MTNVIEDDIEAVVVLMRTLRNLPEFSTLNALLPAGAPFYMFGHIQEINSRLVQRTQDPVKRNEKFPLVALRLDNPADVEDGMLRYNLNIAIIAASSESRNAQERLALTFKPLLNPLYNLFFLALRRSGRFSWETGLDSYPPHTRVDRYYWGVMSGNTKIKNVLSDPSDAIELIGLRINSRIKTC